jgi:hypothetical protein
MGYGRASLFMVILSGRAPSANTSSNTVTPWLFCLLRWTCSREHQFMESPMLGPLAEIQKG